MRSSIILAGGKSTRFKGNKALALFKNKSLIEHSVNVASKISDKIIIVLSDKQQYQLYKKFLPKTVQVAYDEQKEKGPLVGLLTGLKIIKNEYTFVLPIDAPLINPKVMDYLYKKAQNFDAAIPHWPNCYLETLCAVYRVSSMFRASEQALKNGKLKINDAVRLLIKINKISTEELKKFDPKLLSFSNINRIEDLEKLKKLNNNFNFIK